MRGSRCSLYLILIALAAPAALPCQESTDPASLLQETDRGDRVRVLAPPDTLVEGTVASIYARSIVLDLETPAAEQWTTEFESIDAVWTRGRQTWLGAAIGGGAGVILGGLAMWFGSGLCEYNCDSDAGDYALGTLLFGGAGAIVGALVGTAFPKWSLRYER